MKVGDKVRLTPNHPKWLLYGDLIWEVEKMSPNSKSGFIFTKAPKDYPYKRILSYAMEGDIIFVHNAQWECLECDLLVEIESKKPYCPECNKLMLFVSSEVEERKK